VIIVSTLRERILNSDDIPSEPLHVKEWGVDVVIKGMTGTERASFMEQYREEGGEKINWQGLYPFLIIHCAYDPDTDERIFTPEDAVVVNTKSGAALERVARTAMRLSGMGEDEEKAVGKDS
jgi:hypothetical protein